MILLTQVKKKMFVLQDSRCDGRFDRVCEKHRLLIPSAKRLQYLVPAKQLGVKIREREFMIEMQTRLQILIRKTFACPLSEGIGKGGKMFFPHSQARGHFVPTKFLQPPLTMAERLHK